MVSERGVAQAKACAFHFLGRIWMAYSYDEPYSYDESVEHEENEYERKDRELKEYAKSVGAWYYDPESPVVWKRFIMGPVPLWRRVLWWFFPPSTFKMRRIMRRRADQLSAEMHRLLTPPPPPQPPPGQRGGRPQTSPK
jgi:hypothetical protein